MPPISGEFYRRLLSSAAVAVVGTDADFNVICYNEAAGEMLGIAPEAAIGQSIYQLVPTQRHGLLRKLLRRTVQRREATQLEIHPAADIAQPRDLVFLLSPIVTESGAVEGVAVWIVDETSRTQLSSRLAQAEKLASLGTLAGGVAHHFNNILGGVATFVDFALTSGDPTAMKRALQMTAEAASRASKITQSLLSFAKKDAHRTDLADLTEVVLTFSHLVERPLAEHNYRLELELNPVPIIAVEANRMHQILGNLLTNAEEAMPDGGCVTLRVERDGEDVVLTFGDTGCGIEPEKLPLVFEPFFTTKGLHSGGQATNPGLGLSVVHGIVLEMGGRVEVESVVGEGTRFFIRFPIAAKSDE